MGVQWEFNGNSMGIQCEFNVSSMGIQWEFNPLQKQGHVGVQCAAACPSFCKGTQCSYTVKERKPSGQFLAVQGNLGIQFTLIFEKLKARSSRLKAKKRNIN